MQFRGDGMFDMGDGKWLSWLNRSAILATDFAESGLLLNEEGVITLVEGPLHQGPAVSPGLDSLRWPEQ